MDTFHRLTLALAFLCATAAQATELKSGDFLVASPLDPKALAPERAGTVTVLSLPDHTGCKLIVLTAVADAEPNGVRLEPVRIACNTANFTGDISVESLLGARVVVDSAQVHSNIRLKFVVVGGFDLTGSTQSAISNL